MADYSVTVNGTVAADDGTIFSAVAYYDGESFYSFVISESDVASDDNQTDRIYEKPSWFTDIWRSSSGRLYVCDDNGVVHSGSGTEWTESQVSPRHLNTVWGFDDNTVYAGGSEGLSIDGTAHAGPRLALRSVTPFSASQGRRRATFMCPAKERFSGTMTVDSGLRSSCRPTQSWLGYWYCRRPTPWSPAAQGPYFEAAVLPGPMFRNVVGTSTRWRFTERQYTLPVAVKACSRSTGLRFPP
ncbi:hypothetical protein EJ078_08280 [Mesorhizobium sp. M1A.F.Ca.IN.022.06.1.1]|uniref:hypothetical protein n=1 Tax=Mesorhizobium sp. M1A.F.Ca.IN.022.06.1.1 TaxID=2493680 RepID=UPI000F755E25|nr:hypothetical protein [Mesorhizobium sp. M1A.F.Ca.IN.022.06.1.1]AZO59303.1 hypothetical protein EJ078_08280 [Mesorhizobium sp. M1A.F.Ca.IN.022.06.1.1]